MSDRSGGVLRFTVNERIQHMLLMLCVILLMISGLSLRYADTWLGQAVISFEGGMQARGLLHRVSAIGLIVVWLYHALYVVFTERGHGQLMAMMPKAKDVTDLVTVLRRNLTGGAEDPRFDRYDFRQKFQYWAVALGSTIMVATGLLLWFETESMAVMPKWVLDVTRAVHSGEGLLIFVVLFVWHLYDTHLRPGIFPMDWSWLTGRMSAEDLKQRHPLEHERLLGDSEEEGAA